MPVISVECAVVSGSAPTVAGGNGLGGSFAASDRGKNESRRSRFGICRHRHGSRPCGQWPRRRGRRRRPVQGRLHRGRPQPRRRTRHRRARAPSRVRGSPPRDRSDRRCARRRGGVADLRRHAVVVERWDRPAFHRARRERAAPGDGVRRAAGVGSPLDRGAQHGATRHGHPSRRHLLRRRARRLGRRHGDVPGVPARGLQRDRLLRPTDGGRGHLAESHLRPGESPVLVPGPAGTAGRGRHGRGAEVRLQRLPRHEDLVRERDRPRVPQLRRRRTRGDVDVRDGREAQHLAGVPEARFRLRRVVPAQGPPCPAPPGAGQ